jgi:CheY-like chemotaxis protein
MMERFLIIDDKNLLIEGLSIALMNEHIEMKMADTAKEALKELTLADYDYCLLDSEFPDIDVMDLIKEIKGISPKTMIILITSSESTNEEREELERQGCYLLSKPFDLSNILAIVKKGHQKGMYEASWRESSSGVYIERRRAKRFGVSKPLEVYVAIMEGHELKVLNLGAQLINRSEDGVSLALGYPLRDGDMISFNDGSQRLVGVVRWSLNKKDNFLAGVEIIKEIV